MTKPMARDPRTADEKAHDADEFLRRFEAEATSAFAAHEIHIAGQLDRRDEAGRLEWLHFHVVGEDLEIWVNGDGLQIGPSDEGEWRRRKFPEPEGWARDEVQGIVRRVLEMRSERQSQPARRGGCAGPWLVLVFFGVCGLAAGANWLSRRPHESVRREWTALSVRHERSEAGEVVEVRGRLVDERDAVEHVKVSYVRRCAVLRVRVQRGSSGPRVLDARVPIPRDVERVSLGCGETLWERPKPGPAPMGSGSPADSAAPMRLGG